MACDASSVSPFQYSASAAEIIRNPGNDDVCCDRDRKSPPSPSASFSLRYASFPPQTKEQRTNEATTTLIFCPRPHPPTRRTTLEDGPTLYTNTAPTDASASPSRLRFSVLKKTARHLSFSVLCELLCLHVYYLRACIMCKRRRSRNDQTIRVTTPNHCDPSRRVHQLPFLAAALYGCSTRRFGVPSPLSAAVIAR